MRRFLGTCLAAVCLSGTALAESVPACGPELDEAARLAGIEETRQYVRLNDLAEALTWIELDYDAGRIEEAEFLEEMENGEAELPIFQARYDAAKAAHDRLKATRAACPAK
ncbi:MAG: hypothetical protein B7X55_13315 [Rhodobacterales bacterium 34-62-10]|nr:MAG: hypothetical protein B7X55_13315 [Rhodobacterales bacterium 34-62-10]